MKKITAFFMALFPFLVIGVLFATGLITKNFSDKIVQRLEMKEDIVKVQKTSDDKMDYDISGNVRVLPDIVRDPTVYWTTDDETLASVEKETGKVTINELGYGDIKLHAVAKTNVAAKADCTLRVWDDRIHAINVVNEQQAEFMSPGSQLVLNTKTIPSENITNPNLHFRLKQESTHISITPNTGIITIDADADQTEEAEVIIETETEPKVTKTVKVKVQDGVDTIGFDDDGDTLIQEGTYNLYNHVLTSPYTSETPLPTSYFKFESSDESQATISEEGVITFTKDYVPGTFVEFTVKFGGLDAISCKKRVASSLQYYSKVSFDGGYAKNITLSTSDEDITNQVTYTTFPVDGDKTRISLSSSDTSVVEIQGDKIIAHKPGKATLTVSAKVTATSVISDKIDLTIFGQNQRMLEYTTLNIGDAYYYPLRKALTPLFKNKNLKNNCWSVISGADNVIFDAEDETVFFKNAGSCEIGVTYTEDGKTWTDSFKLQTNYSAIETIAIDSEEPKIEVGKKFSVTEGGAAVKLTELPTSVVEISEGVYMATAGCKDTPYTVKTAKGSYSLIATQNLVAFTTDVDWTHFTTNATKVKTAERISVYPANATYMETSWTGEVAPTAPEVNYEFTPEDESAVDIGSDKSLTFSRPTTVNIKVSAYDVTFNYSVTSYCGGNGKFHLSDPTTNKVINTGDTLTINPGETKTYTIDKFYLSEVDVASQLDSFKISAFSKNDESKEKIVQTTKALVDGKIVFTVTGVSGGTDTVEISNGSYSMYLNFKVENIIANFDLYCLGNKLTKYDETTKNIINAYSKDKLVLNMDFSPVVCKTQDLTITFNDYTFTQKPGTLNLSDGKQEGKIVWKTDAENVLTIKSNDKLLGEYRFKYVTTTPEISIAESHKEGDVEYLFLPATSKGDYNIMTINVQNAVFNQNYFKDKITTTGFSGDLTIVGRYIVATSPEAGGTQQVSITCGTGTAHNYTVKRDIVGKIELPKHNNLDASDAKGLQRVHVFGTQSQYPNETKSDVYKLPITLYDGKNQEITGTEKTKAIATLTTTLDGITEAVYNQTSGNYDIKFAKDADHLYTHTEMFNNAFANLETNKNQLFSISTDYGRYNWDTEAFAFYSFVVVEGVNVWDQKAIEDVFKTTPEPDCKLVLQTNFGFDELKESTPWTFTGKFAAYELYGNGYGMNWDAFTKAHPGQKANVYIYRMFNTQMVGCNEATFIELTERSCNFSFTGKNTEEEPDMCAYCTFNNFFQPLTVCSHDSGQDDYYFHIKNSLFFNQKEKCRVAISISNPKCYCTVEDCVFFNSSKIAMLVNKEATVRLKGDIDVYNFHSSDLFDALGMGAEFSEWAWSKVEGLLDKYHLLQGTEYGASKKVVNAYLFTALTGYVQFYDHTDETTGKDVYIESQHGSVKAANYLRYGTGLSFLGQDIVDIWSTVRPSLPLQFGHSPAFSDEFTEDEQGLHLNTNIRNLLIEKITRW